MNSNLRRRRLLFAAAMVAATVCAVAVPLARSLYTLAKLDGVVSLPDLVLEANVYGESYSHQKFRAVRAGMTESQVRSMLGAPLGIIWEYDRSMKALHGADRIWFTGAERVENYPIGQPYRDRTGFEMRQLIGPPVTTGWTYSATRGDTSYRIRVIEFRDGRVSRVRAGVYYD